MSIDSLTDPTALAQSLIRRPSVTPADAGAMDLVQSWLEALGFAARRMRFGEIENLWAQRGVGGPNLCFAGHVDVVPPGDPAAWRLPAFAGEIDAGRLVGRGAVDMKGAVAAWIAALARTAAPARGAISCLITGDEEGDAVNGTRRVVETLLDEGLRVDHCLVGEPTSRAALGDMLKVGRRGSFNAWITVEGVQGHVAYPDRAANPIPVLVRLLAALEAWGLDQAFPDFQPSNLEITAVEAANPANNVIPASARARFNIRFNPAHTGAALAVHVQRLCEAAGAGFAGRISLDADVSGEPFHTAPGPFTDLVCAAVEAATGRRPELSTTGGTSDARFIRALCPVVEFGLVGATMHKVDEAVPLADLETLTRVYAGVIDRYFAPSTA